MRTRRPCSAVVLLVAALLLTACGGGGSASDQPSEPAGTAAASPTGEQVEVTMTASSFEPEEITISAGTTVVWINTDDSSHTVTQVSGPGDSFATGNFNPDARFDRRFTEPGTIEYVCTYHPGMEGTIIVEP